MPATADIRQGDIGTELVVEIVDEDGTVIDVSAATTKTIKLKKPGADGTVSEKTAVLDTDGTDGKIVYVTIADDLDTAGRWKIQGYVVLGSNKWHSQEAEFLVKSNLS